MKKIVSIFLGTFLGLGISEIVVRNVAPQLTFSRLLLLTGEQYRTDPVLPFTLKPNYRALAPSFEDRRRKVTISTNSHGMRGKEVTLRKAHGIHRVEFLGDSFTFGVNVEDEETYPARFEAMNRKVESINAGDADGWSPDEHYAWLLDRGFTFDPDVVVYGFFLGNDLEGLNEEGWRNLDERGLPRKVVNDDLSIDPAGRLISKIADWRTVGVEGVYRVPFLRESHFAILANRSVSVRVNPPSYHGGWLNFAWIFREKSDARMLRQELLFKKLLVGMKEECDRRGVRFVVMMIPLNFQVESKWLDRRCLKKPCEIRRNYFAELKPQLSSMGIESIDLLEEMKKTPGHYFFKSGDVHFNAEGSAFVARKLTERLVPATFSLKGSGDLSN